MLEVIKDKKKWQMVLNDIKAYDCYHTYDYHYTAKKENEEPVLLVFKDKNKIIAIPFLIRVILGTKYFDLTSVYGYAGPLQKNIDAHYDNTHFITLLNDFFESNNIVSVFSRLNPFIENQNSILKNFGDIKDINKIVNIDLYKPLDVQRANYSKITKRYLNKYKNLFEFKTCSKNEDLKAFITLYYENMDRVHAKDLYYFDEKYFEDFFKSEDFDAELLLAILKETGEIVSGAIMIKTNNILQYHISGTKNEYLHLTPIRHLIDEMRIKVSGEGFSFFNLGGGLGTDEDNLFKFKSTFSKDFKQFQIWTYIFNNEVYNKLVDEKKVANNVNFFPLYRYEPS